MNSESGIRDERRQGEVRPRLGILEWFEPGEYERVEQVLEDLHALEVNELRTGFSWAEWMTDEGREWYTWLIPRLAEEVNVLPCFTYTPPELGIEEKCSSPPRDPQDYTDFVGRMIERFDDCFSWVELWNEPNNTNDWDWHLDHNWRIFSEMVMGAAEEAHSRGKLVALAGMCPPDPNWLDMMGRRGLLGMMDAVGVHGFPGTWTYHWNSWEETLTSVREILDRHDSEAELWITEAGYSTWHHDEYRQLQEFLKVVDAPAERIYWYAAHDLAPDRSHQEGFHQDERHYHLGLREASGRPKLLFRIWAEQGLKGVRALGDLETTCSEKEAAICNGKTKAGESPRVSRSNGQRHAVITGGAGFVGANLAHRLLSAGKPVMIYDNLSRAGVERNLLWLVEQHGSLLSWKIGDVRNPYSLREIVQHASQVYHFAGQSAVTTSIAHPRNDFAVNADGTLNVLEALRSLEDPPPLIFTSTNKVYGSLSEIELFEEETRYAPVDQDVRDRGICEERPLKFRSPYGCSKGAADQYVLDYASTYDLTALVFRMGCIYGAHQFGTEDQGWVAHFVRCVCEDEPLTLYGNGKQVRDVLFADDLVRALLAANSNIKELSGEAYNIGGGPERTLSLIELIEMVSDLHGSRPPVRYADWRPGDQRYYVADTSKFSNATGWEPSVGVRDGVERLYDWVEQMRSQSSNYLPIAVE